MKELYSELIIELSRNPKNFGEIEHNRSSEGNNPLCGDSVKVFLKLEDGIIKDISFKGKGCAISIASASAMTQYVKGRRIEEALSLFRDFTGMIKGEAVKRDSLKSLLAFEGIKSHPSRVKCASLCWHALKDSIQD